jgi:hypothetical protein
MAKKKSKLKKALAIGAALAGGLALAKGARSRGVAGTDDAGIHVRHNAMKDFGPYTHKFADHSIPRYGAQGNLFKGGGIAKRGMGAAYKRGGHVKSMGIAKRGGGVAKR